MRNTTLTLIENQGATMADIPRLLIDKDYRSRFTRNLQNQEVADFGEYVYNPFREHDQLEYNRSTLNKIRRFLLNTLLRNIVSKSTSSLKFREIMDEVKSLIVKMSKLVT